jgi:hypothetical protein
MTEAEEMALSDELAACAGDPLRFVETMFPWDTHPTLKGAAPEKWQRQVLEAIRDGLPEEKVRIAVASGHGVGKTALVSWIILWALATMRDTRGVVTASNEPQLRTRNRAELEKWLRLFRGKDFFELTATALIRKDPAYEKTWRLDLLPWNPYKAEAFAGLHNAGRRPISGIGQVGPTAEQSTGPIADQCWTDDRLATISDAIQHVDQKKRS